MGEVLFCITTRETTNQREQNTETTKAYLLHKWFPHLKDRLTSSAASTDMFACVLLTKSDCDLTFRSLEKTVLLLVLLIFKKSYYH